MTELIQLTGNKAEFSNYVTDPIVLKEESRVCLSKASFSIPVIVNRAIDFPYQGSVPDYTKTFFKVAINGVENAITYDSFFDAYDTLDTLQTVTIDEFYSGVFPCFVDNLATYKDDTDTFYNIPTFIECVAQACDTIFDYYKFSSESKYEPNNISDELINTDFTVNGKNIIQIKNFRRIIEFGLVSQYKPQKVTQTPSTIVNWQLTDVDNFTANGDGIVSVDANPAMAVCPNTFDPNGGYIALTPQVNDGKACVGLIFMGAGEDDPLNITGVYQPENLDVGIEFSILGSGESVLQVIDGHNHYLFSHAGAIQETDLPHYKPANPIFTWDHNVDKFWFIVRKGRTMNGTTEFTTTILQGPGTTPQDSDNKIIYVANTTLNTSAINIKTLAYSEGTGNGFDEWEFIPKTTDSQFEDDYQQLSSSEDLDGISSANSLILTPILNSTTDWELEDDFWNSLGITQEYGQFNIRSDINDAGWNKKLKWVLPTNVNKNYWFGQKYISTILNLSLNPNYISFNTDTNVGFIGNIPREIAVSILDLPIRPNVGSFIGSINQFDAGNINKVVNYIQTDKEDLNLEDSQTIDYVYEAFNLVYRKLHNHQKIPITQMKIKLGYKNFQTNKDQEIKNMEGTVKLEMIFD